MAVEGSDDLSPQVPSWFHPLFSLLVVSIAIVIAIVRMGPKQASFWHSTTSLMILYTLAYALVFLVSFLLLIGIRYTTWGDFSITFLGPLALFLAILIYAKAENLARRHLLNLWLRLGCMTTVTETVVDFPAFSYACRLVHQPNTLDDSDTIALLRSDAPGGIAAAPRNKAHHWILLSAAKLLWRQGTACRLPHVDVTKIIDGKPKTVSIPRHFNHATVLKLLGQLGRNRLDVSSSQVPKQLVRLKIITSFDQSARILLHPRFGYIWYRITKSTAVCNDPEAWWFLGAECVQAAKAACGLPFISASDRYADVEEMWKWVERLGYLFRKPFQIAPIAVELARSQSEDIHAVVQYSLGLAGEGQVAVVPNRRQLQLAIEANVVAALGLAVSKNFIDLGRRIEEFASLLADTLNGTSNSTVFHDCSRAPAIVGIPPTGWPDKALAHMIVKWISDSCSYPLVVGNFVTRPRKLHNDEKKRHWLRRGYI